MIYLNKLEKEKQTKCKASRWKISAEMNEIENRKTIQISEKLVLWKDQQIWSYLDWSRKKDYLFFSLAVQWLGLSAFTAMGQGSIPCRGIKTPQAAQHGQKKKKLPRSRMKRGDFPGGSAVIKNPPALGFPGGTVVESLH